MFWIYTSLAFLLAFAIHTGDAVRCYECNSERDFTCGDPFQYSHVTLTDCDRRLGSGGGYGAAGYGGAPGAGYGGVQGGGYGGIQGAGYGGAQGGYGGAQGGYGGAQGGYGGAQGGYGGAQGGYGGSQGGYNQGGYGGSRSVCKKVKQRVNGIVVVDRSCAFEQGYGNSPCSQSGYGYTEHCSYCTWDGCNGAAGIAPTYWILAATAMVYAAIKYL